MASMTRTQITLEEDEHLFLKSQAAQRGTSLSSVVRGLVRERMSTEPHRPLHVWELASILGDVNYDRSSGEALDFDEMLADAIAAEFDRDEEAPE